ncbi:phosphoribosyl-ATP diphosphatase [Rickettsiales bacterium]|jgi:phosphoribosyl-ATP pyrophosphohydrolase|nr:phosphoribosyl-ATP diphosphatase [Rickettsiales bacterium]|tara:strand:- start:3872 stop:4183 length:312 start_codon:yes stop_codon:yes gene_type:complete
MSRELTNLTDLLNKAKNKIDQKNNNSYSYKLIEEGLEKINRKIGEESIEVIIAAFANQSNQNKQNKQNLIGEISDLFYHIIILMIQQDIDFNDILSELNKRSK